MGPSIDLIGTKQLTLRRLLLLVGVRVLLRRLESPVVIDDRARRLGAQQDLRDALQRGWGE